MTQLQKAQIKFSSHSEQGFSLLEALVGILVITLVLVAVTPPIIITMATQVQNRRAEQAMQLAQSEVDRVRTLVAQGNYCDPMTDSTCDPTIYPTKKPIPKVPATFSTPGDITSAPAPTTKLNVLKSNNGPPLTPPLTGGGCSTYTGSPVPADTVLPVDVQGDCNPTFLVQTFRDNLPSSTVAGTIDSITKLPKQVVVMFHLGVRVYSAQAIQGSGLSLLNNPVSCASLQFTSAIGNQQSQPLAVMYTTIARSDLTFQSLQTYSAFLPQSATSSLASRCQ